jgi:hypothetical protein
MSPEFFATKLQAAWIDVEDDHFCPGFEGKLHHGQSDWTGSNNERKFARLRASTLYGVAPNRERLDERQLIQRPGSSRRIVLIAQLVGCDRDIRRGLG